MSFFFISVCSVFYKKKKLSFNREKNIVIHCIVLIYNFLYNLKKMTILLNYHFHFPVWFLMQMSYTVWQLRSIELKLNAKYQQQWRWITRKVQTISAILVQCTYIKYGMQCLTVQRRSEHWICMCIVQGCTHGSVRVCVFVCVFVCEGSTCTFSDNKIRSFSFMKEKKTLLYFDQDVIVTGGLSTLDTCSVRLFEDCTVPNWFFRAG